MTTITPHIPKGFRDFLPAQKIIRHRIIEILRATFETCGFEPLETPCIEYAETLEGKYGEEGDRLIYKFEDRGGRSVALRYDLTIPLCRVISMYPDIVKPFKCYQIAPVWRADKPQRGRYREFYQCDIDIIGSTSVLADAELVYITYTVLNKLGFKNFTIRINNRKLLNALAISAGISEGEVASFLRSLDKLDKIGADGVKEELQEKKITQASIDKISSILEWKPITEHSTGTTSLMEIKELIKGIPAGEQGIAELMQIQNALSIQQVPSSCYRFDITLARGLDYYTGPIFETVIETPKIGSITGGGRYDNLIGLFSKTPLPATGTSFGMERLVAVIEEMEHKQKKMSGTQVLVTLFDTTVLDGTLSIVQMLREAGYKTELYFEPDKLKKQLTYAANKGIPVVVIYGPDEVQNGTVVLRDMQGGKQEAIARHQLTDTIKRYLTIDTQ